MELGLAVFEGKTYAEDSVRRAQITVCRYTYPHQGSQNKGKPGQVEVYLPRISSPGSSFSLVLCGGR